MLSGLFSVLVAGCPKDFIGKIFGDGAFLTSNEQCQSTKITVVFALDINSALVQSYQKSSILHCMLWLQDVSTPTTSASSSPDDVDTSGCDETKACFRVPDDCTTNCNFILTWRIAGPAVSFEMSASVPSNNYWVAFGLSIDQKMVKQ